MKNSLRRKTTNYQIINLLIILGMFVFLTLGCSQINDAVNGSTTSNTSTVTNSKENSNMTANSNANANTPFAPSNSAANTDIQASNTAANNVPKEEVPLTPEAKAFAFGLVGEWSFQNPATRKVTFTGDKYAVKDGNKFIDSGAYRVLDEKSLKLKRDLDGFLWNATIKIEDDGNTLVWHTVNDGSDTKLTRVQP